MKRVLLTALITLLAAAAYAQDDSDWNERKYIAKTMRMAANKPNWNPTKAQLEEKFREMDTDGDGVLTYAERKDAQEAKKK